ncbi:hypothetical protein IMZ31_20485 (plasmid) [Pontibacillus sp. ALD_SL1]|uniref:helix-turn-helix domain-containing protein n=1 Tax=Pontibacillus sp. ALD_SL1 TaxID=2777185 RepID=UPI001A95B081|nr:sigma factor-like helix-turn-helix DNA-binding protein [Pontibacillus sp. ALD_SL1]QST02928.1 hypothetical protein IMZ31_20485 [Pontibacillus sp. ALD_SL1]
MSIRNELTAQALIDLHVHQKKTLAEIGSMFAISRQRVHQLKKEYEKTHGPINRRCVPDARTLKKYIDKGFSNEKISQEIGVSPSCVYRHIQKYQQEYQKGVQPHSLKRKKAEEILPPSLLRHLYETKHHTDREIGELYNLSPSLVNNLRFKYGITTNNKKSLRTLPMRLPKERFLLLMRSFSLNVIASKYGCSVASLIQLKKQYNIPLRSSGKRTQKNP